MATETASPPDQTETFQKLEAYPWEKDAEFQGGLGAILGSTSDPSQIHELTLRAQVFYLSRKKSIPIDFDAYKRYLSSKSSKPPTIASDPPAVPPYTAASSTSEANTGPSPAPTSTSASTEPTSASKPAEAPYPPTFAEIVALITSGATIPGIKDIPPTLLTDQATKPVAIKRRKPWEKEDAVIEPKEGTFGDRRDEIIVQELPE